MLVRMLVGMAGHMIAHNVGDEVVFPDAAGERLVARGFAEKVVEKFAENVAEEVVERTVRKVKAETR